MSISYAWNKFYLAVEGMASGTGTLQERLTNAFAYHLPLVRDENLPEDLRERFHALKQRADSARDSEVAHGNRLPPLLLTDDDAQEIAKEIFAVFLELTKVDPLRDA